MATGRWTDEFLNGLRNEGDARADEALGLIMQNNEIGAIKKLFAEMNSNDKRSPAESFPVLSGFFDATWGLPADVDLARIHRGEEVFGRNSLDGGLVLLTKSLPEGYQAPNLAQVLNISKNLMERTYLRLLATLQTVVNVTSSGGFQPDGHAVMTAQKLRLLHAGVRYLARKRLPNFEAKYGVPVNHEDQLATVMGFSLLVIRGWRTLGLKLTRQEEEDYLYLWLTFGRMMAIHPPYQHDSLAYIPNDLDDATAFYDAYCRRHYVPARDNPDGVALAAANIAMLKRLIWWPLRLLGFGFLPRVCMIEMMGDEACARLGIQHVFGHGFLKQVLLRLPLLWAPFEHASLEGHQRLGLILFQGLINSSYNGPVTFTVPTNVPELRQMVYDKSAASPA